VRPARVALLAASLAGAAGAGAGCYDPVHDQQVAALGPEAPGVPPGPTHRPGQPCLVCHGGQGPAKVVYSVAGTVFQYPYPSSTTPAVDAGVQLEDSTGSFYAAYTNAAGNFYVPASSWGPVYPISVPRLADPTGQNPEQMLTLINRDGSCASCHTPTPGTDSIGPVFLYPSKPGT